MEKITVPYGNSFQEATVPEGISVETIDLSAGDYIEDEEAILKNAMDNPVGSLKLEDMIKKDDKVLIVVNDHTRPGPNKLIVHEIIGRIADKVTDLKQIKFIVATGSHRKTTPEEINSIVGEDVAKIFEVLVHQCKDKEDLAYMGESLYGVPVHVNKALKECTFCIVTGLIAPHHSAGYSGGRKSIVPGLAGFETLKIHHSLPIRPYDPAMGFIYGNPFHEVALDIAKKVNVRFMVNAVQNPHKQNIAFVAGDLVEAHKKGVDICKGVSEVIISEKADIVVISPGGYPRDRNLYQSQKALSVAEKIGNPDCIFILTAECKDGYGEGVLKEWLSEAHNPQEVVDRFKAEGYDVGSNKAFMYARAMLKGRIIVVSDHLNKEELHVMMMGGAPSLQQALDSAIKEKMPNKILVLPNAVNIIPTILKGE
ncbi:MAG: nickel-dependent lactate racemase [Sedimentibacter sp.]|uniref:nickel-dependent lactate racemase n=1 Tax=Sedimentibacter sp. TaxID=1960295 RepID=UPI0031585CBB